MKIIKITLSALLWITLIISITGIGCYEALKYGWDAGVAEHVNKYAFWVVWALSGSLLIYVVFKQLKEK
jgi:hypothetical protein